MRPAETARGISEPKDVPARLAIRTGVGMLKVLVIAVGLLVSGASNAACVKPPAPECAKQPGPFLDVADFDTCRAQMFTYKDGMEHYAACQRDEVSSAAEQLAQNELEQALSVFNERARR
jgi:hypothetical protein